MTTRITPLIACLNLSAVLSIGGCITFPESAPITGENSCVEHADCASGTCEPSLGICIQETGESVPIRLEITPATDRSITTYHHVDASSGILLADVQLDQPVNVVGRITTSRERTETPIDARLTFYRHTERDGQIADETPVEATAMSAVQQIPGVAGDHHYHVLLKHGSQYSVLIEPTGDFAELFAPAKTVLDLRETNTATAYEFSHALSGFETQQVCWGRLVDSAGNGISGLMVDAVDPNTGVRLSTTNRSCSTATPSDDPTSGREPCAAEGNFRLRFPADFASEYMLRIRGRNGFGQWPTQERHSSDLPYASQSGPRLVQISPVQTLNYSGRVDYEDESQRVKSVGRATLSFRSVELEDGGRLEISVSTNEEGEFSSILAPGVYEVSITPPLDSAAGILVQNVHISRREDGADLQGQAFLLPLRTNLSGTILAQQDYGPLSGDLYMSPVLDPASSTLNSWHRANQARFENGSFDTSLDQGTYDLVFRSQHASRLGWHILLGVEVGTDPVELPELQVQNPRLLTGRVLQGAEVMASAEVRAYASIANEDGSTRDVLVGQVQTDEEGNYLMLLPDRLQEL